MEIAIFTISFLLAGFGTVVMAQFLRLGFASTRWPAVRGTIVSNHVRSSGSDDEISYFPDVCYRYIVDGRELTGNRMAAMVPESPGREGAERRLARYPDGAEITVYYNPVRPEESVLETGIAPAVFSLGTFIALVALSIYLGVRLVDIIVR